MHKLWRNAPSGDQAFRQQHLIGFVHLIYASPRSTFLSNYAWGGVSAVVKLTAGVMAWALNLQHRERERAWDKICYDALGVRWNWCNYTCLDPLMIIALVQFVIYSLFSKRSGKMAISMVPSGHWNSYVLVCVAAMTSRSSKAMMWYPSLPPQPLRFAESRWRWVCNSKGSKQFYICICFAFIPTGVASIKNLLRWMVTMARWMISCALWKRRTRPRPRASRGECPAYCFLSLCKTYSMITYVNDV